MKGDILFVIEHGFTSPATALGPHVRENAEAGSVQLSPEDLRELESAASNIRVQRARYPEHLQKMVGR